MSVKYSTVYKSSIYIILFLNLGFLSFINVGGFEIAISIALTLFTIFVYILDKNKKIIPSPFIYIYVVLALSNFLIQLLRWRYVSGSYIVTNVKTIITQYAVILFILLAFPIYEVLEDKNFLKNVACLGYLALLLRTVIWILYNFTSLTPYSSLVRIGFMRSVFGINLLRLQGTFLDPFLIIYSLNAFFKEKSVKKKNYFNFILPLFVLIYHMVVSQYRMNLLACIIVFFIVIYKNINHDIRLKLSALIVTVVILALSSHSIMNFFNSFSINNQVNGASTLTRLNGLPYFINELREGNLLWGLGFVTVEFMTIGGTFWFSDYGIFAELFRFGLVGFIIYIWPIIKGIYYSLKYKNKKYNVFVFGITIFYIVTSVSIDPMEPVNILLLPFYLAFLMQIKTS